VPALIDAIVLRFIFCIIIRRRRTVLSVGCNLRFLLGPKTKGTL
jgi:hypothetical protein